LVRYGCDRVLSSEPPSFAQGGSITRFALSVKRWR